MMSIEEEIEEWKRRWELKGLPKALLDELAEEARREWDIELGYRETKLYYDLIVNVIDLNHQVGDVYKYTVLLESDVIRGILTNALMQTFPQLPAEALKIEVYKMNAQGACMGYGSTSIILNKDMTVDIEVKPVGVVPVVFKFSDYGKGEVGEDGFIAVEDVIHIPRKGEVVEDGFIAVEDVIHIPRKGEIQEGEIISVEVFTT